MASVFLSYDRDDSDRARHFARALEQAGHEVWWDLHVRGGAQFSKVIEEALKAADAVVVLWSKNAVDSAWVRDEAASGRDRGCLVPVTIDGVGPPLGFRQYQTIDLSRWKGRSTPAELRTLLSDIDALASDRGRARRPQERVQPPRTLASAFKDKSLLIVGLAVFAVVLAAGLYSFFSVGSSASPTVAVAAADNSTESQSMARKLLVKLSSLQGNSATNVRLLDDENAGKHADIRITISGSTESGQSRASVSMASRKEGAVLWSRDFDKPGTSRSDLEEQVALSTARVLGCALAESSGTSGRLSTDGRRTFLNACASVAEAGWDKRPVVPMLRKVLRESPRFRPGWALLLNTAADIISLLESSDENVDSLRAQLRKDIEQARAVDKHMAEATLAEIYAETNPSISRKVALVNEAKDQDPDNPTVLGTRALVMQSIGRMTDSVADAGRAAQLDPLSPTAASMFISTLAYGGQTDRARGELEKAKRLWPEAPVVSDAEFALDLRSDKFEEALKSSDFDSGPLIRTYVAACKDPNDANVAAFIRAMEKAGTSSDAAAFTVQGLGEMGRVDEAIAALQRPETGPSFAKSSYVLFRPWLANVRRDPRFIGIAKKFGLVDYWRNSGQWADFCSEPDLPYDCRKEAAKLGA